MNHDDAGIVESTPMPVSRRLGRLLAYGGELAMIGPRTAGFAIGEWARGREARPGVGSIAALSRLSQPELPAPRLSPALVGQAALDELIVAVMKTPGRYPRRNGYLSAEEEILAAHDLYRRRGWIDDPARYHVAPPPLDDVSPTAGGVPGLSFERLSFESGYEPHPGEPGRDRWLAHERNRTAHARVLRHPGGARPWLVCLHAYAMGTVPLDLWAFRASWLHRELGLNVVFPVLPLHGPRRAGRMSGTGFMTYNLLDAGHGVAQAVWDIRRILSWIRAEGGGPVGLYGVSLGSMVAALVAGLEDGLAAVIAGCPTSDLVELFGRHIPRRLLERARERHLIGEVAQSVHRVVSPLAMPPRVSEDARFIFAGLADRMSTPHQALALWEHWGRPRIAWYHGNHVAFLWSGEVAGFMREAIESSLTSSRATTAP